jgi:hypothetical protein
MKEEKKEEEEQGGKLQKRNSRNFSPQTLHEQQQQSK